MQLSMMRTARIHLSEGWNQVYNTVLLAVRGGSVFVILPQESDSNPCGRLEHALERVLLRDPRQNRYPEA